MSFLFSSKRSRSFATLAGGALIAFGSVSFAQVVEDKAPLPSAKVKESDTVKETVPTNPAPTTATQNAANQATNAAQNAAANAKAAADNAAQATGQAADRAADRANNAAGRATGRAGAAANNAAGRAANTADRAADRANSAANNAADRANNAATQGTRTYSNAPNGGAAARVNAGVNAGVNDAAANPNFGRIATQIGLNWAANSANALTLSTIAQNSVFTNAGFLPGDQFVSFGGTPISSQASFYQNLGSVQAGQRVPVVVLRNGQQQTLYWTPDQRFVQMQPTFREVSYVDVQPAAVGGNTLGIRLDESVTDAAVVATVAAGSPAANAGVRQGDQIVALNDQEVHSPAQFESAAAQLPVNSAARISVARTLDLQISPVQRTSAVVPQGGPSNVQPAAPIGVVDPARPVGPVGPVRRFRAR
ncbi:MAG: PDZ domain-containing protein [Planctomycetia bacterium]|nr:PDZ domain-containing protein [Planctomycetia bacterium]